MHSRIAWLAIGVVALAAALTPAPRGQGDHPTTLDQPGRQKSVRPYAPTVVAVRHTSKRPELV